jgi:hypothetical protein
MAMQRLDIENPLASLGSSFGQALGGSLAGGLDALAEHKIRQLTHTKKVQGLAALGLPAEYANLDPKILEQVVHQKLQEPSQRAFAQGLQSILGNGQVSQNTQPEIMRQQVPDLQGFSQSQQHPLVGSIFGGGKIPTNALPPQFQPKLPPQVRQRTSPVVTQGTPQIPAGLNPQQALQLAQLGLQKQALTKKEEKQLELQTRKDIAQERLRESKAKSEAHKETKKYYDSVLDNAEAAKKADIRLGKMERLIEKGGLPVAAFYNLWKNLEESVSPSHGAAAGAVAGGVLGSVIPGIGNVLGAAAGGAIGGLISPVATLMRGLQKKISPNTEEFEKLSADFVRDAKTIYGSRLTDADLRNFMTMIPSLSNTKAGKLAIIKNMKALNKGAEIKARHLKEILKEHKGIRPADLQILVEERSKPELDKMAQEFVTF